MAGSTVAEMFFDGTSHAVVSLSRFQRTKHNYKPLYLPPIFISAPYLIVNDALTQERRPNCEKKCGELIILSLIQIPKPQFGWLHEMSEPMDIDEGGPRGTKRKADDSSLEVSAPRRIRVSFVVLGCRSFPLTLVQALDPDVVNKIAAGEIIVAPVHALKELIENAVDAGSTSLEVLVKDGGLKLLQITDNGHGISVSTMNL